MDLSTPFTRRRGLPIGNLTSQLFANLDLDGLDHFVKEVLRAKGYLRCVDDFALFHDGPARLEDWRGRIARYLEGRRLRLHPRKTHVVETGESAQFLGFVLLPGGRPGIRPRRRNPADLRDFRLPSGGAHLLDDAGKPADRFPVGSRVFAKRPHLRLPRLAVGSALVADALVLRLPSLAVGLVLVADALVLRLPSLAVGLVLVADALVLRQPCGPFGLALGTDGFTGGLVLGTVGASLGPEGFAVGAGFRAHVAVLCDDDRGECGEERGQRRACGYDRDGLLAELEHVGLSALPVRRRFRVGRAETDGCCCRKNVRRFRNRQEERLRQSPRECDLPRDVPRSPCRSASSAAGSTRARNSSPVSQRTSHSPTSARSSGSAMPASTPDTRSAVSAPNRDTAKRRNSARSCSRPCSMPSLTPLFVAFTKPLLRPFGHPLDQCHSHTLQCPHRRRLRIARREMPRQPPYPIGERSLQLIIIIQVSQPLHQPPRHPHQVIRRTALLQPQHRRHQVRCR